MQRYAYLMISHDKRNQYGFTLLELLIAIAIFAIVAVMAMGGYNQLLMQRERASQAMERARTVQRAVMRMTQDFEQLEPRPIRDATATVNDPAVQSGTDGLKLVEFTHAGWTNPAGVSRSTLQRVQYRLTDGKLYRDYWTVLDRGQNAVPLQAVLVDKVKSITLRYMDGNRQWQTNWPASSTGGFGPGLARRLPLAIEVTLTLEDWGEIKRVIEVPS